MGRVLPIVVAIALLVYAVIDCLQTDPARLRSLNRLAWLAIIVLLPVVGPILWIVMAKRRPERPQAASPRQQLAPDDDPEFLARLRNLDDQHNKMLDKWEADLRKREDELRKKRRREEEELRQRRDDGDDGR